MTKLKDKMTKVNDCVTINRYDNGYMVEIGGRDSDDEWITVKLIFSTLDEVLTLVKEYSNIPLNN